MQKNYNSDMYLFSSDFPLISLNAILRLVYNLKIVQRYFGETQYILWVRESTGHAQDL